jgi:hypothetical protein
MSAKLPPMTMTDAEAIEVLTQVAAKKPPHVKFWKTWNDESGQLASEDAFFFGLTAEDLDAPGTLIHGYITLSGSLFGPTPGGHCLRLPPSAGQASTVDELMKMIQRAFLDYEQRESAEALVAPCEPEPETADLEAE